MDITVAVLTIPGRRELLLRTLSSLAAQTYSKFELLVVAAGEDDTSASLRTELSDSRIRVIRGGGVGVSRNAAVATACGEYIAFVDDDDFVAPDFLETLLGNAHVANADLAVCGVDTAGLEVPLDTAAGMEALLRGRIENTLAGKLFRRTLFDGVRFPEDRQLPDIATVWRLFANAQQICVTNRAIYTDGGGEARLRAPDFDPKKLTADYIVEHLAANAEREEYIAAKLPGLRDLTRYAGWSYMLSMVEKIVTLGLAPCYAPLRYMRNELKTFWQDMMYGPFTQDYEKAWIKMYV